MNKPLVSVTINSYNHEKFIQDTIRSIINQTYENIELIIIDDGSTDSTYQKILEMKEECIKRFTNVDFSVQENTGTCVALNRILKKAKGEYIAMIASDDLYKPEAIETEVSFLIDNPQYCLAVGDNEIIDAEGKICYWDNNKHIIYDKNKAFFKTFSEQFKRTAKNWFNTDKFGTYPTLRYCNYIPNGYVIRKSALDRMGEFTKEAPLEDWYMHLQLSKYGKYKSFNKILFSYRWHGTNTAANREKMIDMSIKTFDYETNILKTLDYSKVLPDVINTDKYGDLYSHFKINNIFEISKYVTFKNKITIIKLFNHIVYSKEKKLY